VKARPLIVSLLAFWLAFGPLASAMAQSSDIPCESTGMSMPVDDCCGGNMDQAKCLSACLAVSAAIVAPALRISALDPISIVFSALSFRHASILAPPDIAPPKPFVS
jgi:hypothetical protein